MNEQRFHRWCSISLSITDYCHIAIKKGMKVGWWGKPDICAWYGIVIFGTHQQMEKTEKAWIAAGGESYKKQPSGAWDVPQKVQEIEKCEAGCKYKCKYKEDTKNNLCDSCIHDFAVCPAKNVKFGDGLSNDNVYTCDSYEAKEAA